MKIYVATYGSGGVLMAGTDEEAVKRRAEADVSSHASEFEWREEYNRLRMYYRMADTGRWNKIPSRYVEAVEVAASDEIEDDVCMRDGEPYPEHDFDRNESECVYCGAEPDHDEDDE